MRWIPLLLSGALAAHADIPQATFHLSFDDGLTPEIGAAGAEATVEGDVSFVEGREGDALFVPEGSQVSFPTEGHINAREGTVALWVKRSPPEGRPQFARLFDMTSDADPRNALWLIYPNHTLMYGAVWADGENHIPWPMGDASVREDEWQHLAITWGPSGATFYVNGVTLTATSEMPELTDVAEQFYIAGEKDNIYAACAPIDEFYIFDSELRSHELFELAGRAPAHDLTAQNWIRNPSFEIGLRPWQTRLWAAAGSEVRIDDSEAHGGTRSLLIDRTADAAEWWGTVWLFGPWLHLQRREEVTLSAWVKTDQPGVQVQMGVQRGAEGRAVQSPAPIATYETFNVGTEWQQVTLTQELPISYKDGYRPRITVTGKQCKVWIDDVRMALSSTDLVGDPPTEIGLSSADETTTHGIGSEASVLVHVWPPEGDEEDHPASVVVTDPTGAIIAETDVRAKYGEATSVPSFTAARPGHYTVTATAGELSDSLTIAAIRDHAGTPAPKTSPFGAHGGGHEAARRVGLSQYRDVSGLTWRWIERKDGEWLTDGRQDAYAERGELGFSNCGTIADAPEWAAREGGGLIPADLDRWRGYVRRIITEFKPRMDIWEVWNEPDLKGIFQEQPELYVELLKIAREVQQEVHPEAQLAGLCAAGITDRAFEWMESVMELGAMDHMDILAWHPYYHDLPEKGYAESLDRINELMDKYGGRKPMIFTEFGTSGVSDWDLYIPWAADGWRKWDETEQAAILVRQCAMGLASGAVKLYWYQWNEERLQTGPDTFGLVRADTYQTPKLAAIAYSQMVWALEAADLPPKQLTMPEAQQWGYEFTTPRGTTRVLWSAEGESDFALPEGARIVDLWGNEVPGGDTITLTGEPVYVHDP